MLQRGVDPPTIGRCCNCKGGRPPQAERVLLLHGGVDPLWTEIAAAAAFGGVDLCIEKTTIASHTCRGVWGAKPHGKAEGFGGPLGPPTVTTLQFSILLYEIKIISELVK